jgi:hypothetical protein
MAGRQYAISLQVAVTREADHSPRFSWAEFPVADPFTATYMEA